MTSLVTRSREELQALITTCWGAVWEALGPQVEKAIITWEIGQSPHFGSTRGFATTSYYGEGRIHLKFAEKALRLPEPKLEAILRHEMGHVVDLLVPAEGLADWNLPTTIERRADAIAEKVWGQPVYYGEDLVQTLEEGTAPRPESLGL
jgi:hypothetical protein